jgi:hypothetical protein
MGGGGAAGSQRIDAQELGHLPSKAGIGVKLWNENENEDSRSLSEGWELRNFLGEGEGGEGRGVEA